MTLCKLYRSQVSGFAILRLCSFQPFCSVVWWSERLGDVTREVGHLLAFANSGERKDAHSRGPSPLRF